MLKEGKERKMRRIFYLFVLGVLLLLSIPAQAQAQTVAVGIDAPQEVAKDGNFSAKITVSPITDFDACDFEVTFNSSILQLTNLTAGKINQTSIPVMHREITPGKIKIVANVPGVSGVSGSGYLAEIHFKAVGQSGSSSEITLQKGLISNINAQEIPASWGKGTIKVISSSPPPSSGGSGGGGGGGGSPPAPSADIKASDLEKAKNQGLTAFTYLAPEKVTIAGEVLTKAAELDLDIVIKLKDNQVALTIPPGAIVEKKGAIYELKLKKLTAAEAQALTGKMPAKKKMITPVYDLTITEKEGTKEREVTFKQEILLTFAYLPAEVSSEANLFVYRYNEQTSQWENLFGEGDKKQKRINCKVGRLSKYTVVEDLESKKEEIKITFIDLPVNHWAKEIITFMVGKGFLKGYPDGTCRPENPVTRAEFTALLVRVLGLSETDGALNFTDLRPDHWSYRFVAAAYGQGLVKGYTNSIFGSHDQITREQVATMVTRALAHKGNFTEQNQTQATTLLGRFKDTRGISPWARTAVAGAVSQEIVSGYPDQTFKPQNTATRAEVAAMLKRLYEK
ncbi:MAG TPA: hypothetical protein DD719_03210 [Desulfotomaculum sp.]|nr:hypothetical protein [Desulfotomaculum sp.]HCJ78419.1 hypothetical protein [Desulfotomaculum sp.]